jgi:hypothetical protein
MGKKINITFEQATGYAKSLIILSLPAWGIWLKAETAKTFPTRAEVQSQFEQQELKWEVRQAQERAEHQRLLNELSTQISLLNQHLKYIEERSK